jgi:hypothetical protein
MAEGRARFRAIIQGRAVWVGASPRAAPALPLHSLEPGFWGPATAVPAALGRGAIKMRIEVEGLARPEAASHLGNRLRRLPPTTIVPAIRSVAQPG